MRNDGPIEKKTSRNIYEFLGVKNHLRIISLLICQGVPQNCREGRGLKYPRVSLNIPQLCCKGFALFPRNADGLRENENDLGQQYESSMSEGDTKGGIPGDKRKSQG